MDLSYFNARVKGLRGRLLRQPDYETFLKVERPEEFLERLKSTGYGPYIETSAVRFARVDDILSAALMSNLSETFGLLWRKAPAEARVLLKAVISIWEVYNLKAIIRGIARGIKREDILNSLVPAGELDQGSIKMLLTSKDINDLIHFLDTWGSPYSRPLKKGMEPYVKYHNIAEMELNLDIFLYRFLFSNIRRMNLDNRIIKELLALRADIQNMMTLLKISGEGYSIEGAADFFVEGGARLRKNDFLKMSEIKKRAELLEALTGHIRDADLKGVLSAADPDELGVLEERFDEAVCRRLARLSVIEPLSIALAASFIYCKVREIKNLRLLARGKVFRMPEIEIKRLLLYPC